MHEFLGMALDHSTKGKVAVDIKDQPKKMVEEFEEKCELKECKTPTAEHLFEVNPNCEKSNEEMMSDFHTHTHCKRTFLCKCCRLDFQTSMAFSTTRAKEPDANDWKKLLCLVGQISWRQTISVF